MTKESKSDIFMGAFFISSVFFVVSIFVLPINPWIFISMGFISITIVGLLIND